MTVHYSELGSAEEGLRRGFEWTEGETLGQGRGGGGGGGWREWHPYHLIRFDEVVDVEEVGPPVFLTAVSVSHRVRPERPLPPVARQTHVDHDGHHVHWGQPATGRKRGFKAVNHPSGFGQSGRHKQYSARKAGRVAAMFCSQAKV